MSYRSPSPFAPENQHHSPSPSSSQIAPGSITYTTSTGPDGRIIYHPFKAVPASYQTPNGIVSGIQWVPAEATQILPAGAQPATAEFAASWNRGYLSRDEQKALKDWQRDEERRRRKEEKEAAKRNKDKEKERRDAEELRQARQMDVQARERRKSFNAGSASPLQFPPGGVPGGPGYPPIYASPSAGGVYDRERQFGPTPGTAGYTRDRKYSGAGDLDRQFNELEIERERDREYIERTRKLSNSAMGMPRKYSVNEPDRARKVSGNLGDRPAMYGSGMPGGYPPTGPYVNPNPYPVAGPTIPSYPPAGVPGARPASPYAPAGVRPSSPYAPPATLTGYPSTGYPSSPRPGAEPHPRSTTPFGGAQVYPRGHVLEGQPMPPRSRATTPVPGAGPPTAGSYGSFPQPTMPRSPRIGGAVAFPTDPSHSQLAAPEGFSRPINAAQPYTPFETMKIQDMDDFLEHLPRMPLVLQTHDVLHEDWIRLVQDLALAWAGKLPVPSFSGGRPPKQATLAADLVDLWNASFFLARGVEAVLYKGRERRSGPKAGIVDLVHSAYNDDDDDSLSSSSSSSESDLSDDDRYGPGYGVYGRPGQNPEILEAKRRRRERRAEKKRRRKERKLRRKEKAKEKKYALYLTCVPQGRPGGVLPGGGSSYPGMIGNPVPHGGY